MKHRIWLGRIIGVAWVLLAMAGCGSPLTRPTAIPEPTAMPALETIRLAPDGSGDYASLQEAVEAAPEGGIIEIEAGTYRLGEPLSVEKALSLVGAGMDQTEIVSQAAPYVVRFQGEGPFRAEGITFRHEGEAWADVVLVEGGEIDLDACRFAGGRNAGLNISGGTTGTVRNSVAETGTWAMGILVEGQARPTLEGNESTGNGYGIRIGEQAQPILENNVFQNNELDGIRYDDDAGGLARGNETTENRTGIAVSGRAQPTLEENVSSYNKEAGIDYHDEAGGVALRNQMQGNFGGIGVSGQARPTLEGNVLTENTTAGITYFLDGGGIARKNECIGNGIFGIGLFDQAAPTLEENMCNDNGQRGISFEGDSSGVARDNECSGNQVGIYVTESSDPELEGNRCQDNAEADIQDLRP